MTQSVIKAAQPDKPFLAVLKGEEAGQVPFWLMRQAGRYLPEYRDVRSQAGGFLNLVFDPRKAAEVTLQPLRRFGMDAAILFSDILTVPLALGQKVDFAEGEGPVLDPFPGVSSLGFDHFDQTMTPVYAAVREIRSGMAREGFDSTALIGFAGAPWTLACYMIEGRGTREFLRTKTEAFVRPEAFSTLIDLLTEATIRYLKAQIEAGAEAVQLFDSWAGIADEEQFHRWIVAPADKIVSAIQTAHPHIPVIGFPRGAGVLLADYVEKTRVDAISLDQQTPLAWAAKNIQPHAAVQGNLDPLRLLAGGAALKSQTEKILSAFAGGPFIFNLGHGIQKDTPPENVALLAETIRSWKR